MTEPTPPRQSGIWATLSETRIGSTSLLGCIAQPPPVGVAMALLAWLVLALS